MILDDSEYKKLISKFQNYLTKMCSGFFISTYISNYKILSQIISETKDNFNNLIFLIEKYLSIYQSKFIIHKENYIFIIIPQDNPNLKHKILHHLSNLITLYLCKNSNIHFCHKISIIPWKYNQDNISKIILSGLIESNSGVTNYFINNENFKNTSYIEQYLLLNRKINHIKDIILNNKINLVFQPIIKTTTNKIEYYECLMRLPDFEGKKAKIFDFIMIAERFNLISMIDSMVFDIVAKKIKNSSNLKFSINISNNNQTFSMIKEKIENGVLDKKSASRLIIEITETSNNQNFNKIKKFIYFVNDAGYQVMLDDFGAGFTSLKQLVELPVNMIKIDGSFIKDMHNNKKHRYIVEGIVSIAHKLDIKVIAEFVDNIKLVKILTDMKLDYMQGDFFSTPKKEILNA